MITTSCRRPSVTHCVPKAGLSGSSNVRVGLLDHFIGAGDGGGAFGVEAVSARLSYACMLLSKNPDGGGSVANRRCPAIAVQ